MSTKYGLPRRWAAYATVSLAMFFILTTMASASSPEGRWSGSIEVPTNAIDIFVDLQARDDGSWQGEIDIPVQQLANFPLVDVEVESLSVSFAMAGIPGNPVFRGELTEQGEVLSGEFSQGGAVLPFQLERAGDAEIEVSKQATVSPEVAVQWVGRWQGTLEIPGNALRLALVLVADDSGGLSATLDSPDQGQTGMRITSLDIDGDAVRAELSYLGAAFEGRLDSAGAALAGTWHQSGGSMPLTLRREGAASPTPFPVANPQEADPHVGIPAQALELLSQSVQEMIDREEIVGGELLVIKNRKTVLRKAFGWQDREAEKPLEVDAIYCVRSMTKPLVGTAIQMLIDENRLRLDTPVREILPFFDGRKTSKITIEHLLTHTAGFAFTTMAQPMADYADLEAVAAEAAASKLEFAPGRGFEYSDAGSDTLGAIVAKITGMPVEQFIQERILDPLGMSDSLPLLGDDPQVRARIPSAYSGGTGQWSKHWQPTGSALFPLFLTSQSLYSTTTDYARFLALWMDGGELGGQRLLSTQAIERALAPNHLLSGYPPSFEGLDTFYGQQWIVYAEPSADGTSQAVVFGHDGSDGTHAWAWPEQDLMVLFFTQSRGAVVGLRLARDAQKWLIDQRFDTPSAGASNTAQEGGDLAQLAGLYWDETNESGYYVMTALGDDRLVMERPGRMILVFRSSDIPGRYVHEAGVDAWIEFERDENGAVTAMRTSFGGKVELDPLHVQRDDLPSVAEVVAMVQKAHRVDKLASLGVVRMKGSVKIPARQIFGSFNLSFDSTRQRNEVRVGSTREITVQNGQQAWTYATPTGTDELEGLRLQQALLDRFNVRYGDWRQHYESVEVLKRVQKGDESVLLVRVVPEQGLGATMIINEATGVVMIMDTLVQIPGIGIVGVRSHFDDYRDVGGALLPFRTNSKFATKLLGTVKVVAKKFETNVEVKPDTFSEPFASKN